jgi:hypothetical protein
MAVEITALFDTADSADFALRQLRNRQIVCQTFNIRPVVRTGAAAPDGRPPAVFPMGAFNSVGEWESSANSGAFAAQGYGTLLTDSWRREDQRDDGSDNRSRAVILSVLVAEKDAAQARGVLISEHGRQVR